MGYGSFTDRDWEDYSSTVKGKPAAAVFTRPTIKTAKDPRKSFDPKTIQVRESRDSDDHPATTPLILGFDVTGSMGEIPNYFVQEGLGKLMTEIFDRKPIPDPQILCMATGDSFCDSSPLQVTQFESDIRIAKQLEDIFLEGGGGGNEGESYHLAHYFAATKTSTDAFEKRGKKGLLFTIGDEPPLMTLPREHVKKFIGADPGRDLGSAELIEMARRHYDVFHVIVEEGDGYRHGGARRVLGPWVELLGQGNVLRLKDYTKLSEVVISAIEVNAGKDLDAVVGSWSGSTAVVVRDAISKSLVKSERPGGGGLVRLAPPAAPMVA